MKKLVSTILVFLLVAPLNAGATPWMAFSMSGGIRQAGNVPLATEVMGMTHGMAHHAVSADHHQTNDTANPQTHNSEDCEEHCLSCSNHCSSTGIASLSRHFFDPGHLLSLTQPGDTRTRVKVLFRPPIHVPWISGSEHHLL